MHTMEEEGLQVPPPPPCVSCLLPGQLWYTSLSPSFSCLYKHCSYFSKAATAQMRSAHFFVSCWQSPYCQCSGVRWTQVQNSTAMAEGAYLCLCPHIFCCISGSPLLSNHSSPTAWFLSCRYHQVCDFSRDQSPKLATFTVSLNASFLNTVPWVDFRLCL